MPHIHIGEGQVDFTADVFVVFRDRVLIRMHDKHKIWLAVGGHIELDEDPNQAALREVEEEVGLKVVLVGKAGKSSEVSPEYKELIPPRFMNIHPITPAHRHISLVYFATSTTDEVKLSGDNVSNEWRWFSKEELGENEWGIKESIRHYALTALEEVGWTAEREQNLCRCKPAEGLRSTHCPYHGTCNCCHGAHCPNHDEPERFVSVPEGYQW